MITWVGIMLLALALVTQLAGKWWCTTAAGSAVAATFTVTPSGNVTERIEFGSSTKGGWYNQTFIYDAKAGRWNVKNVGSNGTVFTGTSNGGDHKLIEANGTQNYGTSVAPTRERFILESLENFSLLWEKQVKGSWQLESYSDCALLSNPK
ncbi:MAG TPA: hypothetical protein VMG98_13680 [Verrucomicrobiae bacterium]|nr:hypothetical protein [Verrucomicrobiae bacterium]